MRVIMAHVRKDTLTVYGEHRGPHLTKEAKRRVAVRERQAAKKVLRKDALQA